MYSRWIIYIVSCQTVCHANSIDGEIMPGKGSRERRRERELAAIEDAKKRERDYLAAGGRKVCKTCYRYSRCPVYGEEMNPCWRYGG